MDLQPYQTPQLEAGQRPGSYAIFNSHCTDDILTALQRWNSQRVLLVHSKTLAATTSHISDLKVALYNRLIDSKAGVGSHSPYADVIDIAHKITNNQIDCVVCVGSGSYSDACKTARLLSATLPPAFDEDEMEDLIDQATGVAPPGKVKKAENVKLILVPTSLSAGEWNFAASCTNSSGKKQHFRLEDGCAAELVLMDPWIAQTAPETLWLSSGVRAVDHCIETLCHRKCAAHPDAQRWCEQALADLAQGLVAYKQGLKQGDQTDLLQGISSCQAGSRMALMSYIIYGIPMGASHAIGHQLGGVAKVMHGITSCIMLPSVLEHTVDKNPKAQATIVRIFNDSLGWQETDAGACVRKLVGILGLPSTLREVGVTDDEQIELIIDKTMTDVLFSHDRILERKDVAEIVYSAR